MKKSRLISTFFKSAGILLLLLVVVSSCKKDDPAPVKPKADFASSSATVNENAGVATAVTISFASAATEAGTLTVTIANASGVAYGTDYVTSPNGSSGSLTLDFAAGATSAGFTVTPIDDTVENPAKVITFTLSAATGGVVLGTGTTFTFTIIDNDVPASVNFEPVTGMVAENATEAIVVNLTLTSAAVNAGTFDVAIASADATYTTHYTTTPDGSSGSFTVDVAADATSASFSVMPVDNGDDEPDKTITFTISNPTGGVNIGQADVYTLTITNDDNVTIRTIAEMRALYNGTADVNIIDNIAIKGIVTSTNDATTSRNLFIEDATAAIVVRWDATHTFAIGDDLTINLIGSTISDFNDLVQIGGTMPLINGTVNSQSNVVTPTVVTFAQLNTDDFQAQLVQVEGVTFAGADGIKTVSGNNTGNDGVTDGEVRVESFAPFKDDVLPIGTGTIQGLAGVFSGTAQILPQVPGDIFANNPTSTITIVGTAMDFGTIVTNINSASQTFTVAGATLAEDITVTAPDQFGVSLDDATFTSSVIVTKTAAEAAPVTVYVRFSPTTGFANTHDGVVISVSAGAVSQTLAVTGVEEPPGGGTSLLFADDFDYGGTAGLMVNGDVADGVGSPPWSAHSGGTSSILVGYVTTSLSMTNYPSSGVGGSATIAGSGEDINATFNEQTTGIVYFSALVSISAEGAGGYFFHLGDGGFGFRGRIGTMTDGSGGVLFGIGASSSTLTYGTTSFALNTTYLVVGSYNIDTGESNLHILSAVVGTEPATPETTNTGTSGTAVLAVAMRQGNSSGKQTPDATIDGVRVSTDWAGIMNN